MHKCTDDNNGVTFIQELTRNSFTRSNLSLNFEALPHSTLNFSKNPICVSADTHSCIWRLNMYINAPILKAVIGSRCLIRPNFSRNLRNGSNAGSASRRPRCRLSIDCYLSSFHRTNSRASIPRTVFNGNAMLRSTNEFLYRDNRRIMSAGNSGYALLSQKKFSGIELFWTANALKKDFKSE